MKKLFILMLLLVCSVYATKYPDAMTKAGEVRIENRGIVSDYQNYKMWQDNAIVGNKTWKEAIDYCNNLNLAGYSDWRVPNFNELYSIVDNTKYNPSIKDSFAVTNSNKFYWSSTTKHRNSSGYSSDAWYISFLDATAKTTVKTNKFQVRCIRDGITTTHTGLSNAFYKIYRMLDPLIDTTIIFASGKTSTGDGIYSDTAGMIYLDKETKNQLDDNLTYTLEVTGGKFVDYNNNNKWESEVNNNGTLHAYISGKQLKNGDFRVSILTEIAYQDIRFILASTSLEGLGANEGKGFLTQRAQKLLKEDADLTGDGIIDDDDLIRWNPATDKEKSLFDYDEVIQPILDKLIKNGSKPYIIRFTMEGEGF